MEIKVFKLLVNEQGEICEGGFMLLDRKRVEATRGITAHS